MVWSLMFSLSVNNMFDPNYQFATPLLMAFNAVFIFLATWIPVYAAISFFIGLIVRFFRKGGSRNVLRI